ncbi:alanine racemase, partial [Candidatus Neomarinimicrobiota bacterium]
RFGQFIHMARKMGIEVTFFHMANSGALILEPESHFNMVRPGIALYGAVPSPEAVPPFTLEPVMDLKAPLVMIKSLKKGTPIGYNRTYRAPEDARMGLLQIGYADAYPVGLSGKGVARIAGATVPVLGRVSMDFIAIDLKDLAVVIGDEALLWGQSEDHRLHVESQAELAGTIPYELLTRLGTRVERIYVDD